MNYESSFLKTIERIEIQWLESISLIRLFRISIIFEFDIDL